MGNYDKLMEPGNIGKLKLKNRYVVPPMVTCSATGDGMVTDAMVKYYEERAKGGFGLIIVEFAKSETTIEDWCIGLTLRIDTHKHSNSFAKLTDAIHNAGSKAALQISPGGGSWICPKEISPESFQPVGPSDFAFPGQTCRPLETEEVEFIVRTFGTATVMAKMAGFDAVEIHGHSSYLLGQFMSRIANNRDDKYGDFWRLPVELLQAAKAAAGEDYPVFFRISGEEFFENGRKIDGTIEICKRMEDAGVDCIHVSDGTYYSLEANCVFPYMSLPRSTYVPECQKIREAVSVPLIVAGRLDDPDDAAKVLDDGTADFIAVGRGSIGDPHIPNKVKEDRPEDIRPCLSCNYCIGTELSSGLRLPCVVNPTLFREEKNDLKKSQNPKKVLVVGGGPGGMEAAHVASLRGHQVVLVEKGEELGGQLIEAGKPPHKDTLEKLRQYYITQLKKSWVDVRLNTEFSLDTIKMLKPDAVIMATGLSPWVPPIPGIEGNGTGVVHAKDVLLGAETGDKVAVIGGEQVGCETALLLADQGKSVTVMRRGAELATKVNMFAQGFTMIHLAGAGVNIFTDIDYEEVNKEGVVIKTKDGESKTIEADTVVLAAGSRPNDELFDAVKEKVSEVYYIGDCVEPRSAREAIMEGFNAGAEV